MFDYRPNRARYPLLQRTERFSVGRDVGRVGASRSMDFALMVLRGVKGAGKTTVAHQFLLERQSRGDSVAVLSARMLNPQMWPEVASQVAKSAAEGRTVTLLVDELEQVEAAFRDDFVAALLDLLDAHPSFRVIVAGSDVLGFDDMSVALRLPVWVLTDADLAFTFDETAELLAARIPGASERLSSDLFRVTRGWPGAVHRLLVHAMQSVSPAISEHEMGAHCAELLSRSLEHANVVTRAALILASALDSLTAKQLADSLKVPLCDAERALAGLTQNALQQWLLHGERHYQLHPAMQLSVWAQRRDIAQPGDVNAWARGYRDSIDARSEPSTWLGIYAAFDASDWAELDELLTANFSEHFLDPTPLLRSQLHTIPGAAKTAFPLLHLAALLEEYAFPRGRRGRVLHELKEIATTTVNTASQMVGPAGLLATGMRLGSARVSGQTELLERLLAQLEQRMQEITSSEAQAYRTLVVTLCGQVATTYWYREQFDQAERWCAEGLNLVPAHLTVGEVHLRSIHAAIAAWRGDMPTAARRIEECERIGVADNWAVHYAAVGYWIARAITAVEDHDPVSAQVAFEHISWRVATNENWPYMVWIRAHVLEQQLGCAEAFTWVAHQLQSHASGFAVGVGPRRALDDLYSRLAWATGRAYLIGQNPTAFGLSEVYSAFSDGDFRKARTIAMTVAEEASRTGMWRLRARALKLQVVAKHELGEASVEEARSRVLAFSNHYGLTTSQLERPPWWSPSEMSRPFTAPTDAYSHSTGDSGPGLVAAVPATELAPSRRNIGTLSRAEIRALRAVVQHTTTPEAARVLHLSVHTVRAQMKAVYRKLGVRSRDEAIRAAAASGLMGLSEGAPGSH